MGKSNIKPGVKCQPQAIVAPCLFAGVLLAGCGSEQVDAPESKERVDAITSLLLGSVTPAQAASPVYRQYQQYLSRPAVARAGASGAVDKLAEYAARCDLATGIHVPAFNCDVGTEVPNQGSTPDNGTHSPTCNKPNVLNGACDPGSKFQILIQTSNAAAVAHCRKNGLPIAGSMYNDIAVIQYNKANGAVCFYQALSNLPGQAVAPPSAGEAAWRWLSPTATEAINCTGCHDNGGFIRSSYLAQLGTPPNVLPSTAAGFTNATSPLAYVGLNFVTNRSWSVSTAQAVGDTGVPCNGCHRLAVNNYKAFNLTNPGQPNGTAANFANVATASSQLAKNLHSVSSPIWMRPGQTTYNSGAEASASRFKACALGFWSGQADGFQTGTGVAGCTFTPLGAPWTGLSPASAVVALPL